MNHTEFFKAVKSGRITSLYLMEGEEEYIKQTALELLKKEILPEGMEALNETVLNNPDIRELRAAAETLPFMAEKRLVTVLECAMLRSSKKGGEDGEKTTGNDDTKDFCDYLAIVPDTTCLVFYEKGKADARKKLYGAIKKHGTVVQFDSLSNQELNRWIIQTMRTLGREITPAVAANLAFTVGRDTALLKGEIEKLAAYTDGERQITEEDIRLLATHSLEASVFDMVDALVEGKMKRTFTLFENMPHTGGSRLAILAMILRQYRILCHYKTLKESGANPAEIRSRLGIPPFAVDRAARQASAYTFDQLKSAMALCVQTEYAVKSGRMAEAGSVERVMLHLSRLREKDDESGKGAF